MAQQLATMTVDSDVEIVIRPVPMGADDVNPAPALRAGHGPRDCAQLASWYSIDFPADPTQPSSDQATLGNGIVATSPDLDTCIAVGRALWSGDSAALAAMPALGAAATRTQLAENARHQRARGHYLPGTIRYLGEWFEGPMRVPLVAERARASGHRVASPWRERTPEQRRSFTPAPPGTRLEVWYSFRSPYSYLAVAQLQAWRDAGDIFPIDFRPILPMVMRGLAVPKAKKMYLVKDAAREARRLGIPLGRVADPVGDGAVRCLAVSAAVTTEDDTDRAFNFAVSASRGIWSEGIDVATDAGLVKVAGRADISRDEVMRALDAIDAGQAMANANRAMLNGELGLWGVPSFRVGDALVTWGQDRLHLVRHALGLPPRP